MSKQSIDCLPILRVARNEKLGLLGVTLMEVSFALSRALFVLTRSSIQETVHGLMAVWELPTSINAKASIMPPATAPA
jgi:hypothetical protein